jgi:hypothetical protein
VEYLATEGNNQDLGVKRITKLSRNANGGKKAAATFEGIYIIVGRADKKRCSTGTAWFGFYKGRSIRAIKRERY